MTCNPIEGMQVIGVRYRQSTPAVDDERALDAYLSSGVYASAGIPFEYEEPSFLESQRSTDEPTNLGLLAGKIAEITARARRDGKAILMTGGDCNHMTGVLGGLQDAHGHGERIGLAWFDAHGDFNTSKTTLSGMLGGMPVAVAAGLTHPQWRIGAHIAAPLPTERILMVDVRNLDEAEERLIRATDITIAAPAPGFPGEDLQQSVNRLAEKCNLLYLHIDADILDERYTPTHGTREPNGPSLEQVQAAVKSVMATGKVAAFALVSVYYQGEGKEIMLDSAVKLLQATLQSWKQYGMA
jgi:arginase